MNVKELIQQMTLEEKASLCSGEDFWHTKQIERLDIPQMMVADGPHGLRFQDEDADMFGINDSVPATCFPSGATLACSWDRELLCKVGAVLGKECQHHHVHVILGPAVNIKRSPLCGRNFEYYSEDPYLSSEMANGYINGVQGQGVGTSIKHFAANNQEYKRMSIDTIVDERTLREIYLASFEGAIVKAKPWTVMCSYNKVNGDFASENNHLLSKVLREDWGYEGIVVSDWGAVNNRVKGVKAGLELEMPGCAGISDKEIVAAVKAGELSETVLDASVERILNIVSMAKANEKQGVVVSLEEHHNMAKEVAKECMVLLKNEHNILPFSKTMKLAVIGEFAKSPRFQGGGSSHINAYKVDDITQTIKEIAPEVSLSYAKGFDIDSDAVEDALVEEAKRIAKDAEAALIFVGLPERYESEGYDRKHMRIPANQIALIEEIAKEQSNVVLVLCNGSPIEMPWQSKVKGILEGYLGGQALGGAIAQLLFGDANPCGKLAETFPVKLSDNPSYLNFSGENEVVEYAEKLFVGYRYYDTKELRPLYPFGHGLSYTTFEYSNLCVSKDEFLDTETVMVTLEVTNAGKQRGKEIVQLYVRDKKSTVIRPIKELKGFEKVALEPGETKTVQFELSKRAFAYYNTELADWHVETGEFEIMVASSAEDIKVQKTVMVTSTQEIKKKLTENVTVREVLLLVDPSQKLYQMVIDAIKVTGHDLEDMKKEDSLFGNVVLRSYFKLVGMQIDWEEIL